MSKKLTWLALSVALSGCGSKKAIEQAPQAVQTERISSDTTAANGALRFSAVVEPDARVPVSFRIPGYVTAIKQTRGEGGGMRDLAEGDRVSAGTVLVRIRSAEYEDKVHQAASQAAAAEAIALKAKLDYDRATRLFASQSITKADFDGAQAQYDATQSHVKAARALTSEAEIALRDTSAVAPFDGEIVEKAVELGAFVGPGAPVFTVARTDLVKIVIGVPDTALPSVTLGEPVGVTVDAYGDRTFEARITRMASAADPRTGNFEVEVAIPNRDHALKAGMIGSLELAQQGAAPSASFRVPLSAVVQAAAAKYGVFVIKGADGAATASLRPVEIGPVIGSDIVVVRGLEDGDEVITSGANLIKDGQR
ncbi:MAG TPA: efflux RND transporter periplasmic adaptor subunit, partial [Vicinamibacteria bacterium]|nr:efflux RND transporter periplasmic adaptor subunit [Vicinamibacteria bacterium]